MDRKYDQDGGLRNAMQGMGLQFISACIDPIAKNDIAEMDHNGWWIKYLMGDHNIIHVR